MNIDIEEQSPPRIWRWPVLLATASALGLTLALVGDDWYDVSSWCLLALPVAVIGRAAFRRQ